MKERDLRKYHRIMGVVLAIFILAQAGTGLFFTIGKMSGSSGNHDHADLSILLISKAQANGNESEEAHAEASGNLLSTLHYGGGMTGNIYRLLLAVGIIGQAGGGLLIFKHYRERQGKKK